MEHLACCRIIARIAELGPGLYSPDELPRQIEIVRQKWRAVQREELEAIMGQDSGYDTLTSNAFIYAERLRRGTPVLWPVLSFTAGRASRDLKVRAAFFYTVADERGRETVQAVGWRFEPPEDLEGSHSYYHAQPISSFDSGGRWHLPTAGVLNEVCPAFPLLAHGPVSLLTAVLVSFYGKTHVGRMLADSQLRECVRPIVAKLEPWL
jgi:hypothetical protein